MRLLLRQELVGREESLARAIRQLARSHPRRRLQDWLQRLDDLQTSLVRCVKQEVRRQRTEFRTLLDRLARLRPVLLLQQQREVLRREEKRLRDQVQHHLKARRDRFAALEAHLRLLGPEQVLARGYSITLDAETRKIVRDASETRSGQRLRTRLKIGEVNSTIER
jgi:exodeoxyribonuclease VII large subunit